MDNPKFIASGILPQGRNLIESRGLDTAFLPMKETANGFTIDTTLSGVSIDLPIEGYCLMALGEWSNWKKK